MPSPPPHDDFDGIKLEGYIEPTGPIELSVCWSCQKQFPVDRLVCLGGDCILPVCNHCWDQMSVADRLKQAQSLTTFSEGNESRAAIRKLLNALADHIRHCIESGKEDDDNGDFSWLTGRRN